ncbi:SDR family oxidoreductase [Streptococcus mutans]|uniref:SDR family oxidoreductase n=1 Tax=Streptococcus mutans TaxID=1309 RepID=UPI0002DD00C9|nr:SDR family oxidoreductase [Streptococcus mutans]MCY7116511.1 SDR family oxidoreductase [Streptococcus mutans]QIQ94009.1 SDR family oxidoreductase [Streptococcus mutans]QIR00246.1 SDR family oxidoreductase [Streptococcus mutans]QIR01900.1 SDR family oxidoreductase [Streptococcus mutans]QIR04029.1 SDR family oxidoreductase [Streptococcus mutans]
MIGITGVTGKLGSKVAQLISEQGISARHLARNPQRAALYDNAELVQAAFENSLETVEALKGIDVLLMVSASESPNRLQQHFAFLDAAHEAGVKHIVYTSFYNAATEATFTLARDHAKTEKYIKERGFTYTFLRDNFYLDFFLDLCLNNGEIRGPAGNGKVSAVARQDVSEVATTILAKPDKWKNQLLNMTGPADLSMADIVHFVSEQKGEIIPYIDESIEEAYASRKAWPAQDWEYDAWVSTYTAIKEGKQAGASSDIERVLGRPATSLEQLVKAIK